MSIFTKAIKSSTRLRVQLSAPSGCGKTLTQFRAIDSAPREASRRPSRRHSSSQEK